MLVHSIPGIGAQIFLVNVQQLPFKHPIITQELRPVCQDIQHTSTHTKIMQQSTQYSIFS